MYTSVRSFMGNFTTATGLLCRAQSRSLRENLSHLYIGVDINPNAILNPLATDPRVLNQNKTSPSAPIASDSLFLPSSKDHVLIASVTVSGDSGGFRVTHQAIFVVPLSS
mmetsp:Transcript_21048/g.58525  ORF Transcript_21048/g.58525 Transcript_21048/m.58525 type:complete len:110 (+) Transcript_21048:346-675(+)